MATLTIRNLEEPFKTRLRIRAAAPKRSMAEEAREILRAALQEPATTGVDLGARIHARFSGLGGIDLPIGPRETLRDGASRYMRKTDQR